jgi:hypothetical protein
VRSSQTRGARASKAGICSHFTSSGCAWRHEDARGSVLIRAGLGPRGGGAVLGASSSACPDGDLVVGDNCPRQHELEDGAAVLAVTRSELAAVFVGDRTRDRETQLRSAAVLPSKRLAVEALEDPVKLAVADAGPLSATVIDASLPPAASATLTSPFAGLARSALSSRLRRSCCRPTGSPSSVASSSCVTRMPPSGRSEPASWTACCTSASRLTRVRARGSLRSSLTR